MHLIGQTIPGHAIFISSDHATSKIDQARDYSVKHTSIFHISGNCLVDTFFSYQLLANIPLLINSAYISSKQNRTAKSNKISNKFLHRTLHFPTPDAFLTDIAGTESGHINLVKTHSNKLLDIEIQNNTITGPRLILRDLWTRDQRPRQHE